jgi:hypothetical protein
MNASQPKTIAVGDQVRWTHMRITGSGAELVVREGTVVEIGGNTATVQPVNEPSEPVQVKLAQLEAERNQTIITSTVNTMLGKDEDK